MQLEVSKHRLHAPIEKSVIERVLRYFKDRTIEYFVDYYPVLKNKLIVIITTKLNCLPTYTIPKYIIHKFSSLRPSMLQLLFNYIQATLTY